MRGLFCHAYPNGKLLQLSIGAVVGGETFGCHAYPNGKLLQQAPASYLICYQVVMLTQTVSFYNPLS